MEIRQHNTFSARYEVLRGGGVVGTLQPYSPGEVQCETESELVLSFRGTFYAAEKFNFLTDRLRPVVILNGEEYPLGVYAVTTEERGADGTAETVTLEAYSLLYFARQKKTETRLHISAGENYITVIVNLLAQAGLDAIDAEKTDYTFETDREDWDIGTEILTIVNTLLGEISYKKAYTDLRGNVILRKYRPPTVSSIAHEYTEGVDSCIAPGYKITDDRYDKANVFRLTCDNPDKSAVLVAIAENNSPDSPFSIPSMGGRRILHAEKVDNVPTQEALQERANAMRDKSMQSTEEIEFYTAIAPVHVPHDTVAIQVGGAAGIFAEIGWRLTMSPEEDMTHTARRVIT